MKTTLISIAAAALLVGCETTPTAYYPPTNPGSVVVTTEGYNGAFQFIKDVANRKRIPPHTKEEACQELQEQAAAVGADMVIDLHMQHDLLDGDWLGSGKAIKIIK